MSFAHNLKNEICNNRPFTSRHKMAQAYGLLLFSKYFSMDEITLHTEHPQVAKLYAKLIWQLSGIKASTAEKSHIKTSNGVLIVTVDKLEERLRLLDLFEYKFGESITVKQQHFSEQEGINAFISGAFLACGNASNPEKGYHLEFAVAQLTLATELQQLLLEVGIDCKVTLRRGQYIVYLKDSTKIEEIITFMGAPKTTLSLMDTKIYKELRNNINRATNCETANIEKTAAAATGQVQKITDIIESGDFDSLPRPLKELALLRMRNPEMTLRELGEALNPPLTRSGVNHRLMRLMKIASQIKSEE